MALTLLYVLFIVIGLRFFTPSEVGIALMVSSAALFGYHLYKKAPLKDALLIIAAFFAALFVTISSNTLLFKALPIILSATFFLKFLHATYTKKPFLGDIVKKVPKVPLNAKKLAYIDSSHGYWSVVNGINLLLQIVVMFAPLNIWALYTTVGWYLLFGIALMAQILYGKMHGI